MSQPRRILMPLGDATEALDTFYPFFRLPEDGYEVVVAGPEARLYHSVLHEIPPDSHVPWDITQERPGYHIRATVAFRDLRSDQYVGMFISGGRAPEYLRYDADLLRVTREIHDAGKPIACVCHGIEILTAAELLGRSHGDHGSQVCVGCPARWCPIRRSGSGRRWPSCDSSHLARQHSPDARISPVVAATP